MSDLIDRQAAIDLLKQMRKDGDMIPWEGKDVFARIRKLPSAQLEIIRCKDCQHSEYDAVYGDRYCHHNGKAEIVPDNHYCGYGERRTDE